MNLKGPLLTALVVAFGLAVTADAIDLRVVAPVEVSNDGTSCRIVVSAYGQDGQVLRDLGAPNFMAAIDGKAAELQSVERATLNDQPLAVVLAIDISGSMRRGGAIAACLSAAQSFVAQLDQRDQIALVAFGSRVTLLSELTADRSRINGRLAALTARDDRTVLYDAVLKAGTEASAASTSKAAVVVLTDGKDEGSGVTVDDAIYRAKAAGVPVYTIGFGPAADERTLRRIAALTGAEYMHAASPEQMAPLYQRILETLKDRYAIQVKTPKLSGGRHRADVTVSYRGLATVTGTDFRMPGRGLKAAVPVLVGGSAALLAVLVGLAMGLARRNRPAAAPVAAPACLVWLEVGGRGNSRRVPVVSNPMRIGSTEGSEVLITHDAEVEPDHAQIRMENDATFVLKVLAAKGSMLLNGNRLSSGQGVRLRSGDRMRAGATTLVFVDQRLKGNHGFGAAQRHISEGGRT